MKNVVITGSSTGIGLGLAKEFLKKGCNVALTSFAKDELAEAYEQVVGEFGADKVMSHACDVSIYEEVEGLWKAAKEKFGTIDIWVNNAGISNSTAPVWGVEPGQMKAVINTNVVGTLYGFRVAMLGMTEQGSGDIYNFYGHGSWDEFAPPGLTVYGTSKRAVRYMTEALIGEMKESPIRLGWMMPGLVMTDFVKKVVLAVPAGPAREGLKKSISVMADTVDTVTPWLVDECLKNVEAGTHGAEINYMTPEKAAARKEDPYYLNRDLFENIEGV
jgi:NAD(P)-dependent dehydrogenase (short-subunit alcohol dehydrogenase family)